MPLGPDSVFVVTGAAGSASSRRSRPTWPQASGGTFHLLDLTPTPDADDADLAAFRADKDAPQGHDRHPDEGARRAATPVAIDKELAGSSGCSAALTPSRRSRPPAARCTTSVDLTNPRPSPRSWPMRERSAARSTSCCTPPGSRSAATCREGAARIRPRLRRQDHGLVQRVVRRARHAGRCGRRLLLGRRAVRQPGPDRLQRGERPAVQGRLPPAPHPAADPGPGPGLDGLGRHRHGDPRLHPQDHGDGRGADAAARRRASPGSVAS
jgi:hypothetical protein